ncbi:MAG: arginine deiminase family protein [Firmicutes bacterium]|nr:arginine deiminase family protein [Bacillota bacterium]
MNNTGFEKISVNYEWGTLREVVVGCPNARIGTKPPEFLNFDLPDGVIEWIKDITEKFPGRKMKEIMPEMHEQMKEQIDAVVSLLENRGIKVHRVPELEPEEELFPIPGVDFYTQMFPRDVMLVIGEKFIENAPYYPMRRREKLAVRRLLKSRLENHMIVSMPEPLPVWKENCDLPFGEQAFLEGGDVLLFGKDILVGNSGNASSVQGINWLRKFLGNEYNVQEVKIRGGFLHLDCALCVPKPGFAMICREAFVDGIPDLIKDWELLDVSFDDAKNKLGCNGLILDQKNIIISAELPHIGEKLDKAGFNVITTPFSIVYIFGGALRCWHHPLIRE